YCNHDITYGVDVVKCLKEALLKFNVKDIEAVYAYILSKPTQPTEEDLEKMLGQLQDAYKLAYPNDKEGAKIDKEKAKNDAQTIKNSGGSVTAVTGGGSTTTSTNSSGSGSDGQADTIFIILGAVMVLAAGTMLFARKKREE
ncbi:MAG: LPXTG cell wall anchor domain-containing protein, partial [Ruminococcus sp.]